MHKGLQDIHIQHFRTKLLHWNAKVNNRKMPWKGEKDPYKIWLSEIILQQTRVEQGLKYYEKFVSKYATIQQLAKATDDDVLKDWEGLGYYSRCRNLLHTARLITNELDGKFPEKYDDILALKGVGVYTASAIASFAYKLPHAVVDGNVVRVLSRFVGTKQTFISSGDKKYYQTLADAFLSKRKPDEYNQAIMDFGATLCKPQSPSCEICPLAKKCVAFQTNAVAEYPVKKKKLVLKKRIFHYIVLRNGAHTYIQQRGAGDIWQSLYQPILIEQKTRPKFLNKPVAKKIQKLSHQELTIYFYEADEPEMLPIDLQKYKRVRKSALAQKAFPKSVFDFFKEFKYI